MAWTGVDTWNLFDGVPYIKISPYTGYYQIRRKYEDSASGSSFGGTSGFAAYYYSWSIIRNRLRAVYPSGGRMGMCIVLEKVRTGRYCPYNSYTWPEFSDNMPLWSIPTTSSKRFTDYTRLMTDGLGDFNFSGLTYGWTVGYGEVQMANDTHPPAGFCTDLAGCLIYIQNTAEPAQVIELETNTPNSTLLSIFEQSTAQSVVMANRYDIAPLQIQPELVPGVESSGIGSMNTYRPSGIYWPAEEDSPISSNTFDVTRILPEVETWRDANIFPIGYDNLSYTTYYISNFPRDYTLVYGSQPEHESILYSSNIASADQRLYTFNGFVYWVTREGPVDIKTIREKSSTEPPATRSVYNFIFEASIIGIQDNTNSKYRATINNLVGTNAIAPRCKTSDPESLLQPYGLQLGGPYNSIFDQFGMDSPGAPANDTTQTGPKSEIAFHYDVSGSVLCGNVIIDDQMFDRVLTSGQVHSPLWSEVGYLYRFTTQQKFPGLSYSLVGLMATIGDLAQTQMSMFKNRYSLHLGGMTYSVMQNNTMPEIGVALGLHRTGHTIYMIECGKVSTTPISDDPEDGKDSDPLQIDINKPVDIIPKKIYTYTGFASSPHRVTFCKNGLVLIPTDIGILQYDLINNIVLGEWLNPTLIPIVQDAILLSGDSDVTGTISSSLSSSFDSIPNSDEGKKYIPISIDKKLKRIDSDYETGLGTLLSVDAEDVYARASNIGSYGQITYENGDFSDDLIVLLNR